MKHLTKNYYVEADPFQFILKERNVIKDGKHEGRERFDNIGYHSRPELLHRHLLGLCAMEHINSSWNNMIAMLSESEENFKSFLKEKGYTKR